MEPPPSSWWKRLSSTVHHGVNLEVACVQRLLMTGLAAESWTVQSDGRAAG
jgi:hypothetical protein